MQRLRITPRADWQRKVEELGLLYHTPNGTTYWDESTYYRFTMAEVLRLEQVTNDLSTMCLDAVQHVIDHNRFAELGLSDITANAIRQAWEAEPPSIYGRMDFAYTGRGDAKLLEYNADTPTSLLEASVVQWFWKQERFPAADQWNSIHERLVEKWRELRDYTASPLYFAHVNMPEHEDLMTVTYLRDTAGEAGITSIGLAMADIGYDADRGLFVDLDDREMSSIFKLYPWEWMVDEEFGDHLFASLAAGVQWIEPIWKMVLSNKGILPILWELYPGHPNLLPAYFDGPRDMTDYVRKPIFSREGANVQIIRRGTVVSETDGEYGEGPVVYQGLTDTAVDDSAHVVLGSWLVDHNSAGLGLRESDGPITDNLSRFVPHIIEG